MENQQTPGTPDSNTTPFIPPRHWLGPEQLSEKYWTDAGQAEKRGQEFFEKPIEMIDKIDQTDAQGLARREFLTIMGASMAMASFACARRPVHKIIPYVVKPEEIVPGVPVWYASTFSEGVKSVGVLVKNREGRPIKLEGNPDHPFSKGALSASVQAALLGLYDTDRLKKPMSRNRSAGTSLQEISWTEADEKVISRLKATFSKKGKFRILTGEIKSPTTLKLIKEFAGSFADPVHVGYEPIGYDDLVDAQSNVFGEALIPRYRFDQAQMVVSFGADFLGTWIQPELYANEWAKNRKLEGQDPTKSRMSKLVSFEPVVTLTGANSDERFAVKAGDEYAIAMALVSELVASGRVSAKEKLPMELLASFSAEKVAQSTGLRGGAATLRRLAHELLEFKGKSLVVAGGVHTQSASSFELQLAVNLLNLLLENDGQTVDGVNETIRVHSRFGDLVRLVKEMNAGQIDTLVIYKTNPVFSAPLELGFAEALKKVSNVILITDREDETSEFVDFVLPDHHFLENWGDATPCAGWVSLQQPALAPIGDSRSLQDSLIVWAKGLGLNTPVAKANDWHGYLKNQWKESFYKDIKPAGTFDQFWEGALRVGVLQLSEGSKPKGKAAGRKVNWAVFSKLPKATQTQNESVSLALYTSIAMGDGRNANNPWLQELPDPISSVTWDNYLAVSPALGAKLKLKQNDVVKVKSGRFEGKLPVLVQPGMHENTVGIAIGYGRRKTGKIGSLAGVDVYPATVLGSQSQRVMAGLPVEITRTDSFYPLAMTQWHFASEQRPIINDVSFEEFRHNPKAEAHTNPHLRLKKVPTLWKKHEYKGYRWGMSIDLNSCTGCGACAIACQAENNIPVVGRAQVRNSRQMHWIRIDRYYSGTPDQPEFLFQPMLCQHCENAPCETVCPVVATVHDDEGLNAQVYNRCVGTRYCQNNCPYKVRRFNFFDHWKSYEGTMNLVWNPDVTVRTRGIMEKCTFCVQRIRDEKDKSKVAGLKVQDGQIKTACQQTCPTEAIVFGDMNDAQTEVSQLRSDPRAFKVLEVLNTEPAISYLTKVRNRSSSGSAHGNHGS